MPIPDLLADGLLPSGIHPCTPEEIEEYFGRFTTSDRRMRLMADLRRYIDEVRQARIGDHLIVDGSFVTNNPEPNDVDVLLVLRDDVDLTREVPPFQYNVRSKGYVRKHFRLDFYFGFASDDSSRSMIALFRGVRGAPGKDKGILKVAL